VAGTPASCGRNLTQTCCLFNRLSSQISQSVGRWEKKARNLPPDVKVVQRLLEAAAQALQAPQLDPKGVDGKIARPPATSNTITAIEAFQSLFTSSVDGLIKPDSQTWHALLDAAGELAQPDISSEARGFFFPFPALPASDWIHSPRAFASNRSNGARAHAGCDLYFKKGTWIYAIGDVRFGNRSRRLPGALRRNPSNHGCEGRRSGSSGTANREGWALGRYSSSKRYVALGTVRQECFGTADNHGYRQIEEKIRWHSVYAPKGLNRSYSQTRSVAGAAPASLGARAQLHCLSGLVQVPLTTTWVSSTRELSRIS